MSVQRTSNSDAIRQRLRELQRKQVEAGFFETAHYPDGTPVAYVAAIQEFGSPSNGIPAHPFFRPTIAAQQAAWRESMREAVAAIARGDIPITPALTQVGLVAAGGVAESITKVTTPALSDATIYSRQHRTNKQRNMSTKPLIDTALMLQSVTAQVTDK